MDPKHIIHEKVLSLRRIETIIETKRCEIALAHACEEDKKELVEYIEQLKEHSIRDWVYRNAPKLTYRYLRELGKRNNIYKYSRMPIDELKKLLLSRNIIRKEEYYEG